MKNNTFRENNSLINQWANLYENDDVVKESKKHLLKETSTGDDIIRDLVERTQLIIDDGEKDIENAVRRAIDDGLIYTKDIYNLLDHYRSISDSEIIQSFYDDLFADIYKEISNENSVDESLDLIEFDKSVRAPEKNKIKKLIWKELGKSGITKKYYSDNYWKGPHLVFEKIKEIVSNPRLKEEFGHEYDVSMGTDRNSTGYKTSSDGHKQWKEYNVLIYLKGSENPFMGGVLNCHAAGTVEDPFSRYDMSFMM